MLRPPSKGEKNGLLKTSWYLLVVIISKIMLPEKHKLVWKHPLVL